MRRKYTTNVKCGHDGCGEYGHYEYDTRADYMEGVKWRQRHPYYCSRHSDIPAMLSPESTEKTATLTVEQKSSGKYWNGFHGVIHGNGYKAFAEDFPVGTKITVTAKITLPPPHEPINEHD